ncbi:LuxR C-terminal-related transcriptional regulator [Streptomyces sp. NPDC002285]
MERGSRWPLVGRELELEAFKRAWRVPRCQGVVIFGPAGVGKSRLAEDFLDRVAKKGWKSGRATATTAAAAVPLGAIAHLIPAGIDLSDPVKGFAAVARALAGPQGDRRWVVFVDDIHLLDAASAMLLRQLLDAGVVRLIGTARSGERISDAVAALTGEKAMYRIDLEALSLEQVDDLLQAVLGAPVGRRTLHELYNASGGNALYLRELVLGALAADALKGDRQIWELAEGALPTTPQLAELIGARLVAADPAARPVLDLLALCEPLPLADAQTVAPPAVLADLEDRGLVQVFKDRRRTALALAHPLYGEVLRARLPELRRRDLLLEQARRVEANGAKRREDSRQLATWRLAATGAADPTLLSQAAVLARHAHDYAQVVSLLAAIPEFTRTTSNLLLLGEAYFELGKIEEGDATLAEAERSASREEEVLAVTVAHTFNLCWIGGRTNEAIAVNDAALTRITTAAGTRVLEANEASMRTFSGQPMLGLAVLEDLEESIDRALEVSGWLRSVMIKTVGLAMRGRTDEALRLAEQAYSANQAVGDHNAVPHPASQLVGHVLALSETGRLSEARQVGERAFARLTRPQSTQLFASVPPPHLLTMWIAYLLARTEWLSGHLTVARRWYAEAAALARAHHHVKPMRLILSGITACAALLGDHQVAQATQSELREYANDGPFVGEDRLGEAWLHASQGRVAQARVVLLEAAQMARDTGHITSEALLVTDLARLGDARTAADRLADLAQAYDGVFAQARVRLAAAFAADAPDQLLAAADELESIGADLMAAESASAAAAAWRRAGQTRKATVANNRSQELASRCRGAHTPLLSIADAASVLTAREQEVALLAVAGLMSREIAENLHLSVRTVDNHLQHVYNKLGVETRRELAVAFGAKRP